MINAMRRLKLRRCSARSGDLRTTPKQFELEFLELLLSICGNSSRDRLGERWNTSSRKERDVDESKTGSEYSYG